MDNIKGAKLEIWNPTYLDKLNSWKNLEGWFVYIGKDSKPGFYLRASSKNKNYGITLTREALKTMLAEIDSKIDDSTADNVAYGTLNQSPKLCGSECPCRE